MLKKILSNIKCKILEKEDKKLVKKILNLSVLLEEEHLDKFVFANKKNLDE